MCCKGAKAPVARVARAFRPVAAVIGGASCCGNGLRGYRGCVVCLPHASVLRARRLAVVALCGRAR
eukprot:11048727-Lingulodinium_polyedra.AAC.1